ncbi:hypothetical protein ANN_14498 [Periplaneta americana]|uniref:Mariner Mos1 transposase n=1 Tax=Periplaneta americana TaxID=6978 RepID=A0ABQ8SWI0_PERAM|nr:hypothetical protein ANN_14498 [Periplaneta americana]
MATVFWDTKGILLVEFLERNATINAERYCNTLTNLKKAIQNKRRDMLNPRVIFLHDNSRPHTARHTATKLQKFNWKVLDHSPCSPDFAPSDYYLFMHMKTWLGSKRFDDDEELKTSVIEVRSSQSIVLEISRPNVQRIYGLQHMNLVVHPKKTRIANKYIGNMKINSMSELQRLAGVKSMGDAECPTVLDIEICSEQDDPRQRPNFGVKCKIFELDACQYN